MLHIKSNFGIKFYQAEPRELIVSARVKKIWAVTLDLLIEFDRVCRKRSIKYFLDSGTLLGAVRHKGFIPWDDDVDVIMKRGEYRKLCECAPEEFKHPYFFQNNETDPGSMRGHAQLRNSLTTGILRSDMCDGVPIYRFNQGIFMDIFILDKIPNDDAEYERFAAELSVAKERPFALRECKRCGERLLKGHWGLHALRYGLKGLCYMLKDKITGTDSIRAAYSRFDSLVQKYDGDSSARRCASIAFQPFRPVKKRFPVSIFDDSCEVSFEGRVFPAPKEWDTYLRGHYGNWHEHIIGSSSHGGVLVDTERPYTDYFKK